MKCLLFNFLCILMCSYSYAQIIDFPDTNLKAKLLEENFGGYIYIDSNNNGEIEVSEAQNWFYSLNLGDANISDLSGIEFFTNVKHLQVHNNNLVTVNISSLTSLNYLKINDNSLTSLNLSNLVNLESIQCYNNHLSSLDFTGLTNIKTNSNGNNQLTSLILNNNLKLSHLYCENNSLTSLDVSQLPNLLLFDCSFNNLTTLNIKNESKENIDFSNNESLIYICADGEQLSSIEEKIIEYGYTNCYTNSICDYEEGESFYTISGNSMYDNNTDGCDALDIIYPNLVLSVSNGVNSGSTIANSNGDYHYDIQAGTYTITPILENTTYFSVSPDNAIITFPDDISPNIQDFCITANGFYPDLEVEISWHYDINDDDYASQHLKYEIIYKNKGTTTQSGTINLTFEDSLSLVEFYSSTPMESSQNENVLAWNFADLKPFESRKIIIQLHYDGYLIMDSILELVATINSSLTDETPSNNTFTYNETLFCCLLGTKELIFSDYFALYPNPTNQVLNLKIKKNIDIKSIEIYNLIGQQVQKISNINQDLIIDVSNFESGNYFLKISTPSQVFNSRFNKK